jgi:hypothetical protein
LLLLLLLLDFIVDSVVGTILNTDPVFDTIPAFAFFDSKLDTIYKYPSLGPTLSSVM